MCRARLLVHDEAMNDTQQSPPSPPGSPPPPGPDEDFDPQRLRTITDMQRSQDDRIVAGVCAGAARYLNVDPVIVRVLVAVLTIAGFAGVILYVAAWLLLPADDEHGRSIVAGWFKLDDNEPQVRTIGLVAAAALAVLSLIGNSSWAWWGDAPWWIIPFALLFYVFWLRPQRRREARMPSPSAYDPATPEPTTVDAYSATVVDRAMQKKLAKARAPRSPALLLLTMSLTAIALAVVWIVDETRRDVPATAYIAVALTVVGVGLLIGTLVGDGGPLIAIGVLLATALAIGSVFPTGRIGEQRPSPTTAADVEATYRHGIGELELDLTQVVDPERLAGRTIALDAGIGDTRVILPDGLRVVVLTHVDAGATSVFGRSREGTDVSLAAPADDGVGAVLTVTVDQQLGQIEVITR